jgi:uncharacterized repeat protein (TIGR03803 family)
MTHKIYAATIGLVLALTALAQAQTFTTLYNFSGGSDGNVPFAGVIEVNGNIYGTTYEGGAGYNGAVFEVTKNGKEKTIHSFGPAPDGNSPQAPLIRASNGKLYAVASFGGANNNYGAVFEVDSTGAENVLHSFAGGTADGCDPEGGLLEYKGELYGTTTYCGAYGYGVIFRLTLTGKETVIHSFTGGDSDGASPIYSSLVVNEKNGTLYGLASEGGKSASDCPTGCGVLFQMNKKGKVTALHAFAGSASDGCTPWGTPAFDKNGNLYGTTLLCGANGEGTLWKITQKGAETILHSFYNGKTDGAQPYGGVAVDSKGNFYGATFSGGTEGSGALYELSGGGDYSVIYSFQYSEGAYPVGQVIVDSKDEVYGTASGGGTSGAGTVWKYQP